MAKFVETPLMKQYVEMKAKHPDAVLLFRVGDFYETFSDDAITTSEILGITLTKRANGAAASVELAGFPHHALDTYLPKLVRAGKRVAICEQLEDPKLAKKLVKRGITELVTPGVSMNDNCLDHKENNFLAAIHIASPQEIGLALLDISTGEFLCTQDRPEQIDKLMGSFGPKELLIERGKQADMLLSSHCLVSKLDDWVFTPDTASSRLLKQFQTGSLKGFGVHEMPAAIIAAGAILHYLDITKHTALGHITALRRIEQDRHMRMDKFTVRNLELVQPLSPDGMSLRDVLDHTVTPMGARLLYRWLMFPLKDVDAINRRLSVVEHFFKRPELREIIHTQIGQVGDLERLTAKAATARISPREVGQLRQALEALAPVKGLLVEADEPTLQDYGQRLDLCPELCEKIKRELVADPPSSTQKGNVIAKGVNEELDNLREIAFQGRDYLRRIQEREQAATGITSLKIAYNNVFGYYIEVTNTHRDKVPADWIRKQTLVNAERYITPELKEYEEKILGAQDRILILEAEIFTDLVRHLSRYIPAIQLNATLTARMDCLLSFSLAAKAYKYHRPVVDDSLALEIVEGRHPVIERRMPPGEPYISNSVSLDNDSRQVMMITGPNMSGKSALLRQTALNVIMAQCGCFVAADSAHIGMIDKVFTRVGASDNISLGESTFMVEMNEAASILNNMSRRSLILFDELGRGTSTYDGISIARAIVEYIHEYGQDHPKTLFATHYHELNELEESYERVVNYNVSVKEIDGHVVFLRKLAKGGSEHSFGIHVAKLAGMPKQIVDRAEQILHALERARQENPADTAIKPQIEEGYQMSFFQLDDPVLTQLRDMILKLEIDRLTPLDALNKLHDIRSVLTGK